MKSEQELFLEIYGKNAEYSAFAPYRICPLGAHVDHNLGKITGFCIDKGINIAYTPEKDGKIEVSSLQFSKTEKWEIGDVPKIRLNSWADHLRGCTLALGSRYPLKTGMTAIINGELPIGGLSSSAAVTISFLSALCNLNDIELSPEEMIEISREAENSYVGVSCGKLDQACVCYCRRNGLLYMDLADESHEIIPTPANMKPFDILICFSGLERSLASSKYNMRVDELRAAAYALKGFSGMEYGKFAETNLREVPYEIYLQYRDKLPESWAKRAEHWYSEVMRVEMGVKAYRNGDIEQFGQLCFESGKSSICSWETGSPELIKLYKIMTKTKGVYGGRFSGAGFKGCCMALVDPAFENEIMEKIEAEYLQAFPELKDKYLACICHSADGITYGTMANSK